MRDNSLPRIQYNFPQLFYSFNAVIVAVFNCRLVLNLLETRSVAVERPELIESRYNIAHLKHIHSSKSLEWRRTKIGQSYFIPRAAAEDHQSTFETFFIDTPPHGMTPTLLIFVSYVINIEHQSRTGSTNEILQGVSSN